MASSLSEPSGGPSAMTASTLFALSRSVPERLGMRLTNCPAGPSAPSSSATPATRAAPPHTDAPAVRRQRRDGPPTEHRREKGSRSDLLQIAADTDRCDEAEGRFKEFVYAPSSLATKTTKVKLWTEMARAMAVEPLPVTPAKVMRFAAVLRDAGYRSGISYIYEAVQQHSRAGFQVDDALKIAVADAKRGLARGLGGPVRSAEVRPEWLDQLQGRLDEGSVHLRRRPEGPREACMRGGWAWAGCSGKSSSPFSTCIATR